MPSDKKCKQCGEVKPTSSFYKQPRMRDGLMSICKDCRRVQSNKWEAKNKDKKRHLKSHLKQTYGVSLEQCDELRKAQDCRCRICGIHESEATHGRLCVDHCHSTGRVRGLLCKKCNSALGLLGENRDTLRAAIEYLNHEHRRS